MNNVPWYRINDVSERIPALSSTEKAQDFLQLRCTDYREIKKAASQNSNDNSNSARAGTFKTEADMQRIPLSDTRSFIYPDPTTTRIVRKAGKMTPTKLEGKTFNPILCIRYVITAWFQKQALGQKSWTGALSFDPVIFTNG